MGRQWITEIKMKYGEGGSKSDVSTYFHLNTGKVVYKSCLWQTIELGLYYYSPPPCKKRRGNVM